MDIDLEALSTEDLIEAYEAVRDHRGAETMRLHNALAWRVYQESPTRCIGVRHKGILYCLDCCDELVRTIVGKRKFTVGLHRERPVTQHRRAS